MIYFHLMRYSCLCYSIEMSELYDILSSHEVFMFVLLYRNK
jgi:hypothetical protein